MKTTESHFYNTIHNLRKNEELILYDKVLEFNIYDEKLIKDFLEHEYNVESINFPFTKPTFNSDAAYWAAKTFYLISQLVIYREHRVEELESILTHYEHPKNPSSILSADLCLRFLPLINFEATIIDQEDKLLIYIRKIMAEWIYSSIGHIDNINQICFVEFENDKCINQLFIDRIIERKDKHLAKLDTWNRKIKATMGDYQNLFWKELNLI